MIRRPPRSPLFPYPPLFRSSRHRAARIHLPREREGQQAHGVEMSATRREFMAAAVAAAATGATLQAQQPGNRVGGYDHVALDRKSTRLNSSHLAISYAVFCL